MKKILLASLISISTFASAVDWVEMDSNNKLTISLDADTISYTNERLNHRFGWLKVDNKVNSAPLKAGEYTLASHEFDCKNSKFRVTTAIAYTVKGEVKTHVNQVGQWTNIAPQSNFEYIYNSICSYPYI